MRITPKGVGCAIPSAAEVVAAVSRLDLPALRALAATAGVPYATLWNIHRGASKNPQLETVRKLWPHLAGCMPSEGGKSHGS